MGRPPKGQTWSVSTRCALCGALIVRNRAHMKKRAFCDNACYGASKRGVPVRTPEQYAAHGRAYSGDKNPNWKGGKSRADMHREWIRLNRDRARVRCANRRARKRNAEGVTTLAEWLSIVSAWEGRCAVCDLDASEVGVMTRDHIVPLSRGGSNWPENIQPLCRSCNSKKKDRLPFNSGATHASAVRPEAK